MSKTFHLKTFRYLGVTVDEALSMRPLHFWDRYIEPLYRHGSLPDKLVDYARQDLKKLRALRRRIWHESDGNPRRHRDYERYKKAKDLIKRVEMVFY